MERMGDTRGSYPILKKLTAVEYSRTIFPDGLAVSNTAVNKNRIIESCKSEEQLKTQVKSAKGACRLWSNNIGLCGQQR